MTKEEFFKAVDEMYAALREQQIKDAFEEMQFDYEVCELAAQAIEKEKQ